PVAPVRQHGCELLAEQARDVTPTRREAGVHGRRDQHFDDGLLRPSIAFRGEEGAVHIVKRGSDNDARLVVLARLWQAGETRQFAKRDIHAEGTAANLEALHPAAEFLRQVGRLEHPLVKELRADIRDDALRRDLFPALEPYTGYSIEIDQHP